MDFIVFRKGWHAGNNGINQWIQVEFDKPLKIAAIQTQRRAYQNHRTTKYKISYSQNGAIWTVFTSLDGSEKVSFLRISLH